MSVLSPIWFCALALVPAAYWLIPEKFRSSFLVALTLAFLVWYSVLSAVLLVLVCMLAWSGYRYFANDGRIIAAIAALQALPLIYYRIEQQTELAFGSDIIIPLGLSYYTLRAIHYTVEAYKGALLPHRLEDVLRYMFFLPTVLAGPIHRFPAFLSDQRRRRWNPELFSQGLERLIYGYVKITFLDQRFFRVPYYSTGSVRACFNTSLATITFFFIDAPNVTVGRIDK